MSGSQLHRGGPISAKYGNYRSFKSPRPATNAEPVTLMNARIALVAGLLAVSGCTTTGLGGQPSALAPAGNPTNPKVAAAIIEAMDGGLVGGAIGTGLDQGERNQGLEAEYRALEYTQGGQKVTWKNDRTNRYGEVVAAQPYRVGSQDCRQYSHTVYSGGPAQTARGTACRNSDGSWTKLT